VGINQLELDYGHASADSSFDTSIKVVGAHAAINVLDVSYTHNFAMLGQLAWAKFGIPFASVSGSAAQTNFSRSIAGMGDATLQFATLLKGGRVMSEEEFEEYTPDTTLALSITVSAPTGQYDANRL
jgi:hypothetical protein